LFPIINVACNSISNPPFNGQTEQEQRECSNNIIDAVIDLQLEIDGKSIDNLEQYRLESPPGGFELEIVPNNFLNDPSGTGTAVSDGYWILLKLSPGPHTVSFQATADLTELFGSPEPVIFTTGATYNLDLQKADHSYYPEEEYSSYSTY
jgi:hypothetical protein